MTETEYNQEVASTIRMQLGGSGKLSAMISAKNWMAYKSGLGFKFSGCRKWDHIRITLNSMDTYDIKFYRVVSTTGQLKEKNINGIYCDGLKETIERETGLYLSL